MKKLIPFLLILYGCVKIAEGIKPVENFEVKRYLGRWYEIARLDHSFERSLVNVSAEYSIGEKGEVKVLNRGFSKKEDRWKEAKGRAYFVDGKKERGFLRVSFFGPFYGSYIIVALDKENYKYSLVCGHNKKYLWILSREKQLPEEVKEKLVEKAKSLGFETEKLIWVEQE